MSLKGCPSSQNCASAFRNFCLHGLGRLAQPFKANIACPGGRERRHDIYEIYNISEEIISELSKYSNPIRPNHKAMR